MIRTADPGFKIIWPSVTTVSPALTPLVITAVVPCVQATVTGRIATFVGADDIDERAVRSLVDRRRGNGRGLRQDLQRQLDIDELAGPEFLCRVRESAPSVRQCRLSGSTRLSAMLSWPVSSNAPVSWLNAFVAMGLRKPSETSDRR